MSTRTCCRQSSTLSETPPSPEDVAGYASCCCLEGGEEGGMEEREGDVDGYS